MAKKNNIWLWLGAAGVAYYLYSKSATTATAAAAASPVAATPLANLTAGLSTALSSLTAPLLQLVASPVVSQPPAPPIPVTQTKSIPDLIAQAAQQPAQIIAPLISTVNDASGNPIIILPTMPDSNYYEFVNNDYPGALPKPAAIMGIREMGGC